MEETPEMGGSEKDTSDAETKFRFPLFPSLSDASLLVESVLVSCDVRPWALTINGEGNGLLDRRLLQAVH